MNAVRLGLQIRALRRRKGWTQAMLGARCGATASAISRLERGRAAAASLRPLEAVAGALEARLAVQLQWQGEALDRLLDAEHAALVDWTLRWLAAAGWEALPEVTFQVRGDRGSVDVLARHASGPVLVVEVKSVIPDAQSLLASLDRKARLAPMIVRERGWPVATTVGRMLVVPSDRTARRRVAALEATFGAALPQRTVEARRWVRSPAGPLAAVMFVPNVTATAARHRVGSGQGRHRA
ncbi:MAG TPA: helix-turn-helix domain-containing protein [Candidatus Limnocylindrales bacterium]